MANSNSNSSNTPQENQNNYNLEEEFLKLLVASESVANF
jgi:flagellar hook assembly protein FlgD